MVRCLTAIKTHSILWLWRFKSHDPSNLWKSSSGLISASNGLENGVTFPFSFSTLLWLNVDKVEWCWQLQLSIIVWYTARHFHQQCSAIVKWKEQWHMLLLYTHESCLLCCFHTLQTTCKISIRNAKWTGAAPAATASSPKLPKWNHVKKKAFEWISTFPRSNTFFRQKQDHKSGNFCRPYTHQHF